MKLPEMNAGYTIAQHEVYRKSNRYSSENCTESAVVLARNLKTGWWATWECRNGNDFFWGHYFETELDARRDYHERLAKNYDMPWSE